MPLQFHFNSLLWTPVRFYHGLIVLWCFRVLFRFRVHVTVRVCSTTGLTVNVIAGVHVFLCVLWVLLFVSPYAV